MTHFLGRAAAVALALVLSACAGIPERIEVGTARADIVERLGRPTGEYALADGVRLQYSLQPMGRTVHNLDLDAQGRLQRVTQTLDIHWMQKNIAIDRWTREDVLRHFGRPALVERVAFFDGDIWTYRFLENNLERLAHVHMDPQGVVRKLVFTDEYSPPPDRS